MRCDVRSETRSEFFKEADAAGAATGGGESAADERQGGGEGGGGGTHGSAVSQRQSDNQPFRRFHSSSQATNPFKIK